MDGQLAASPARLTLAAFGGAVGSAEIPRPPYLIVLDVRGRRAGCHTATVSASEGSFTAPTSGSPVTLTISATGPAVSTQQLTFRMNNKPTSNLTATTPGTVYSDATATINKN